MKEIAKQKDYLNDKYIIKYIDYIKFEKRLSENTIKSYLNDIEKLYSYNKNYYKFTSKDINKYLENLDYLDNRSVAHLITVLRSLYAFLNKEGIISHNPCNDVIMSKLGAKLPNYLTIEEVNKLLDVNLVKPNDYRNKAMLELCFATGLRVSELVNLKVSDINFNDCYLRVMGKGKKERIVPIDDIALKYVKMYNDYYRNKLLKNKDSEYLFISSYASKITRQAFFKLIKSECAKKGIEKEISPHTLRHSFASVLLKNGANIRVIQELLGHEDLKTTQIYTHLINEKLKKDYEEYHPRSRKE